MIVTFYTLALITLLCGVLAVIEETLRLSDHDRRRSRPRR